MLDLSTKKCVPCNSKDIRPMTEQSANELITKVCINPCLTFVLLLIRLYCFELIYQFRCRDGTCQVKVAPWSCSVLGKLKVSWKDWRCLRLLLMLQRLKVRFSSSISEEYRTPKPLSMCSLLRHIVPPIFLPWFRDPDCLSCRPYHGCWMLIKNSQGKILTHFPN